jgi:ferredoxin
MIFMEHLFDSLYDNGFIRIAVLDGKTCGIVKNRLILCFIPYEAAVPSITIREAVIHRYYPVSQKAYNTVRLFARECQTQGIDMTVDSSIHIKNLLDRLPFLKKGRNTLSYFHDYGSRFHVQVLTSDDDRIPITDWPDLKSHDIMCGECRKCIKSCPSGAIQTEGFVKERCLRYWMLSGKLPPEEIALQMGNRLIGCDECEACCPQNPSGTGDTIFVPIRDILENYRSLNLCDMIGKNYAIPNRITAQACIIAGSLKRTDLKDSIQNIFRNHPSPICHQAAEIALGMINNVTTED